MTTNVFDPHAGMLATDSRWSVPHLKWLIYLDDTGVDKIERYQDTAFMFAGKGKLIQEWKDWIRTGPTSDADQPEVEGICVSGLQISTREVKFSKGESIKRDGAVFAGSGALHAFPCWDRNRDAIRSVNSAKQSDVYTGGTVVFLNFATGETNQSKNVLQSGHISDVDRAILERGLVMEIGKFNHEQPSAVPFKLKDLVAAGNDDLAAAQAAIIEGSLSAQAPCDQMYSEWTAEDKAGLQTFLGDVFGWKK